MSKRNRKPQQLCRNEIADFDSYAPSVSQGRPKTRDADEGRARPQRYARVHRAKVNRL